MNCTTCEKVWYSENRNAEHKKNENIEIEENQVSFIVVFFSLTLSVSLCTQFSVCPLNKNIKLRWIGHFYIMSCSKMWYSLHAEGIDRYWTIKSRRFLLLRNIVQGFSMSVINSIDNGLMLYEANLGAFFFLIVITIYEYSFLNCFCAIDRKLNGINRAERWMYSLFRWFAISSLKHLHTHNRTVAVENRIDLSIAFGFDGFHSKKFGQNCFHSFAFHLMNFHHVRSIEPIIKIHFCHFLIIRMEIQYQSLSSTLTTVCFLFHP